MRRQTLAWAVAAFGVLGSWSGAAFAAPGLAYGPPPAWVKPPPPPTHQAVQADAPVQMLRVDAQSAIASGYEEHFRETEVKILSPAGLTAGHLSIVWNPGLDALTVNRLTITRGGKSLDVLATDAFEVVRTETGLEQEMLDGDLTATLQVRGLEVGDVLTLATTRRRQNSLLQGRVDFEMQGLLDPVPGRVRMRTIWPRSRAVRWRTSPDLARLSRNTSADGTEILFEADGLGRVTTTDGAPPRFNVRRRIEYSDFASWAEVSAVAFRLFESASKLRTDSPLKAEATRIRAASAEPAVRAALALQLVQESVRYVYIGLNAGALIPVAADETWSRRFGDCKAKTALLLALLGELGIPAEAVLVSLADGDGLEVRLPGMSVFDHVLARARVGNQFYWLDSARSGDRSLATLEPPPVRWALPVRDRGGLLEPVPPVPPDTPMQPYGEVNLQIDASGGLEAPTKVTVEKVFRGAAAAYTLHEIQAATPAEAEAGLMAMAADEDNDLQPETVEWSYDEDARELRVVVRGVSKPKWRPAPDGTEQFAWPIENSEVGLTEYARPAGQDATAPFKTEFPLFQVWSTMIRLPLSRERTFSVHGAQFEGQIGGYSYARKAELSGDTLTMRQSIRALNREISADMAAASETKRKWLANDELALMATKQVTVPAGRTRPRRAPE